MPLARGTAAVGYTTMLGLFWAAGMPISSVIPKDYQVCSPCELTWFLVYRNRTAVQTAAFNNALI
jgi:hypothetical protein